ncbi:MAG: hypothetical protein GX963_08620 [Bacteroidales bacterium]|nr:hypothetical protein [Bacteroidales bacterium]
MQEQEIQNQNRSIVTLGDWIITLLIMIIPFVNFIMLFVWAFSSSTPQSKANWAKASLIFMLIGFLLLLLFWGTLGAIFLNAAL